MRRAARAVQGAEGRAERCSTWWGRPYQVDPIAGRSRRGALEEPAARGGTGRAGARARAARAGRDRAPCGPPRPSRRGDRVARHRPGAARPRAGCHSVGPSRSRSRRDEGDADFTDDGWRDPKRRSPRACDQSISVNRESGFSLRAWCARVDVRVRRQREGGQPSRLARRGTFTNSTITTTCSR